MYCRIASALCVGALATLILMSASAGASAPDSAVAVLRQSTSWLNAIVGGDAKIVGSILSPNFTHITSNASEQTVDFAGDAAVVHGLNTLVQSGKTLARERYTNVYVKENGTWMVLSAQETQIAP